MKRRSMRSPRSLPSASASLAWLTVAAAGLSCATPVKPAQPAKQAGPSEPSFVVRSPARWLVFPQSVGDTRSVLVIDEGHCLVTTDDGQRWLVDREPDPANADSKRCVGKGRASGDPASEALAFAEAHQGGYRFLSDAGALYTSATPTGPFRSVARPPELLSEVSARGATVIGVAASGAAYRFDDEWTAATVPPGTNAIDVGVAPDGTVLLLSVPETLLFSADAGKTFAPFSGAPPKKVGAYSIEEGLSGAPLVVGAVGTLVQEGDRLVASTEGTKGSTSHDVFVEPIEGPNVFAVEERRAAIDGATYVDVVPAEDGPGHQLRIGPLTGPFERSSLPLPEECAELQLAAGHGLIAVGCITSMDAEVGASFYVSKDRGKTFERGASVVVPSPEYLGFSVAENGALLVVGACKVQDKTAEKLDGLGATEDFVGRSSALDCSPRVPLVVKGTAVATASAPDVETGTLTSPLLSREGRLAYVFGRKKRTSEPAIFVSRDGGKTFRGRVVENPNAGWEDDDEDGGRQGFYVDSSARLTMDDTGTLGMRCVSNDGDCWLTFDSDGRVANVGSPPEPATFIDGRGNRVFSIGSSGRGYESVDGGATWGETSLTGALALGYPPRPSYCSEAGCLLGAGVVREGWEGQEEKSIAFSELPTPMMGSPSIGDPFICDVVPNVEVTRITGRGEERGGVAQWSPSFPRLRDIGRGRTAFSVLSASSDGEVSVFSAAAEAATGKPSPLTKKTLLKATKNAKAWTASTVRWQVEGYAAVRATIPTLKGSSSLDTAQKLKGLEVAWQNQFTDSVVQRRADVDATWSWGMVNGSTLRIPRLSVAGQGLVIQTNDRATFVTREAISSFFEANLGRGMTDRGITGPVDYLAGGKSLQAVSFLSRAPYADILAFASVGESRNVDVSAVSLAPEDSIVDYTYQGESIGVSVVTAMSDHARDRPRAFAMFFKDDALGPAVPLPTLDDLSARPRACTADERMTTPRSVSSFIGPGSIPLFAADRSPVLVTEPVPAGTSLTSAVAVGPTWMLVDGAVIHGTPSDPCVAFYRASSLRGGAIAILSGDLQRAWLLRSASGEGGVGVEVKPIACKRQPDALVPADVQHRAALRLPDDVF